MSIFIDNETKVVVQGLTGEQGKFHALRNRDYGTKVVAGTRPGARRIGIPFPQGIGRFDIEFFVQKQGDQFFG